MVTVPHAQGQRECRIVEVLDYRGSAIMLVCRVLMYVRVYVYVYGCNF